ncbi:FAD-dependent oxidoreductase [Salinibius halmophilus]|uniref:FAD-dependent oxidoreductase n=1 Tax=Salinibius halmophilus TaxID=1853216 RepID=UPI000E661846|nr:FAD-dependent oxidoreductase [Salinibius halmophilus]
MSKKIVIIGGVAGGASAAARARRLDENAEIIVFERDSFISFANCGLPYHIGGEIAERSKLLVQTPESMKARFELDIRIRTEVINIDGAAKTVTARDLATGNEYQETYDALILSPGASPIRPPIPGIDSDAVFTLRNIPDMDRIIRQINIEAPKSAVVVGGGYIGIEMAEALIHRGIETTMVEMLPQIMASVDPEMATPLHQEMRRNGVRLKLSNALAKIEPNGEGLTLTLQNGETMQTDMVIMAIGVRPETKLAQMAGLEIGTTGGIKVDAQMKSSVADIYAVGDAIEVTDFVTQQPVLIPLAGPANRQGRIAAEVIFGRDSEYKHTQGTSICKVFDLTAANTGANEKQLKKLGLPFEKVYVHPQDHAGYYPGATPVSLKLLFNPEDGKLYGAQAIGAKGVDKRIDVMAVAIRAGLSVFDLEEQELCYAPPFGSAKDVINQAGFVAANVVRGDLELCHGSNVPDCTEDAYLVDVRNPAEIGVLGTIEEAKNIPLHELRNRLDELPKDRTIVVFCAVGLRGYVAYRLLQQHGFKVRNLAGGYKTYQMYERIGQ